MSVQDSAPSFQRTETPPARGLGERARSIAAAFGDRAIQPSFASGFAAFFETSILVAVPIGATVAVFGAPGPLVWPILAAALLTLTALKGGGAYEMEALRRHQTRLGRTLATWIAVAAAISVVMVVGELMPDVPRTWYLLWLLSGVVGLTVGGALISTEVRRRTRLGQLQRRAVIVGGGPAADSLIRALETEGGNELHILGIFDDRDDVRSPESSAAYPKLGAVADLVDFARLAAVDLLIVSIPMTAETRLLQLLKQLWVLPVDIRLAAHGARLRLRPRSYSYIGRVPFLDLFDRPIAGWDSVVKRVFDVVFASLAVVALSPVMLAVALAIRLDSRGPALFRQKRYGFNNEVIEVLKFRSMFHDMADPAARKVVTRDDPRVTRVGRFIRRTSLDELPQFFNVLKGELSLVGPRPHAVNAHTSERLWEEVVDGYFARHKVKPGVTGWAQINGWRGEVDTPEKIRARVEHDLHYIENWSVFFDLYILMLTPIRILNQETAY